MGICKRKDGRWQVTFRDGPKVRTKTFPPGREGKKLAQAFDADVKLKKATDKPLPLALRDGIYLDELAQLWIDEKKAQGRRVGWLKDWANILNKFFLPELGSRPAKALTQADVLAVVTAHYADTAQATRNRYIDYLKSIFEYGVEQGHLDRNPLARWKKGKEGRRRSPLTLEGLRAIQAVSPPHLAWALEVTWNVPVRPGPSDLFALRFDRHVSHERGGFEAFHTKVSRWAYITCSAGFMAAVREREAVHASGHVIEYKGRSVLLLKKALATAARKAELPYSVCLYDIRHLWITTTLDQGLEPSAIAYLTGTSIKMIHANYYEPHAVERERAASLLPSLGSPKAEKESSSA